MLILTIRFWAYCFLNRLTIEYNVFCDVIIVEFIIIELNLRWFLKGFLRILFVDDQAEEDT